MPAQDDKLAKKLRTLLSAQDRHLSLREIARAVGVSHETVRRRLDGSGYVSSPHEAALLRSKYPKPWQCTVCGKKGESMSWNDARRKACAGVCRKILRRPRVA